MENKHEARPAAVQGEARMAQGGARMASLRLRGGDERLPAGVVT